MPTSSTHDEFFVRVLALSCKGMELALISMDILFVERGQVDRIKGAIENLTGLRAAEILINFTRTHCSPRVARWAHLGNVEELHIDHIERCTLRAGVAAGANRKAVTIEAGSTTNFDGRTGTALPFCLFREKESGRVLALLFSVACHPSMIYEFAISAAFPEVAVRHLNHDFSTDGGIFFQGAASDAKPRPAAGDGARWIPCNWEQMEEVGKDLASRDGTAIYLPDREDVPFGGYEVDSLWEYHQPSEPTLDCNQPLVQAVRSAIT